MEFYDYWNEVEKFIKNKQNNINYLDEFVIEQDLSKIEPMSILILNKKFFPLKIFGSYPIIVSQDLPKKVSWLVIVEKNEDSQSGLFLYPYIEDNIYRYSDEQEAYILEEVKKLTEAKILLKTEKFIKLLEQNLHVGFFFLSRVSLDIKKPAFDIKNYNFVNETFEAVKTHLDELQNEFDTKTTSDKNTNISNIIKNISETGEKIKEEIENTSFPPNIQIILNKELKKLDYMNPASPDYSMQLTYVEMVKEFPFNKYSSITMNPKDLLEKLNKNHFGLEKVKSSIVEHIALQNWTNKSVGEVICLIGDPGVGKSSLANVVANELQRKFIKIALGGLSDESEFRGHRRTYLGSEPGRLVKEFIRVQTSDPLIVLDEIDKMNTYRGSPADALLEILDPEQNDHFTDRYFGFPIDISKSLFICTANYEEQISAPLKDRMQIFHIDGYTQEQQFIIAKDFLVPKYKNLWNLNNINIDDDILSLLTKKKQCGVRDIEKAIKLIFKKSCYIIQSESLYEMNINMDNIKNIIEPSLIFPNINKNQIGFM